MVENSDATTAAADERKRIARELHDCPAQVLSVAHLRLRALDVNPVLADAPDVRAEITELADLCQEALLDVRESIAALQLAAREDFSLTEALGRAVRRFSRCTGVPTALALDDALPALPVDTRQQLLRVAQEALMNARKHADAHRIVVGLRHSGSAVILSVADDGCGFDVVEDAKEGAESFGIRSMRERAQLLGGALTLRSAPGWGTRVEVEIPLSGNEMRRDGLEPTQVLTQGWTR